MDLSTYLQQNQNINNSPSEEHSLLVESVISKSKIIGVPQPMQVFREVGLFCSGVLRGIADVIFLPTKFRPYIVECKTVLTDVYEHYRNTRKEVNE